MVRTLIDKVFYIGRDNSVNKGFILFDNERIIDIGSEPDVEYELSEYVLNYEYKAVAFHGFSALIDPFKYPFRGLAERELDTSIYSERELEVIIQAVIYEMLYNGFTLPALKTSKPEQVIKVATENDLRIIVLTERGVAKQHSRVLLVEIENNTLYYNDEKIGVIEELICSDNIVDKCLFIDLTRFPSINSSFIIWFLTMRTKSVQEALKLLVKPYIILGVDSGFIDKDSKPDIVIYDLRDSRKTIDLGNLLYVTLRGYPPDSVFAGGDQFFDRGESLYLIQPRIDDVILRGLNEK